MHPIEIFNYAMIVICFVFCLICTLLRNKVFRTVFFVLMIAFWIFALVLYKVLQ